MGSKSNKTKIEVPSPYVYQTTVPEEDFEYGKDIIKTTQDRIKGLKDDEKETVGNLEFRGMQNAGNRVLELGSYLSSIPADQGSYTTQGTPSQTTVNTFPPIPYQSKSVQESGYDPTAFGGSGVGMKDLAELQRQGFNRDQISDYVTAARNQGLNIGGRVEDSLAFMNKASTKEGDIKDSGYDPASFGNAGFGFEDVKALAAQGYGKEQIASYVSHLKGQKTDVPYQSQSVKDSGFDPTAFGNAGVGMKDLQELQKRGFNRQQISDYVDDARSRGLNVGGRVDASLKLMNQQSNKSGAIKDSGFDPGAFGNAGVGFEDVKELARQGYGKEQITDYVNYAKGQGLNIGGRVGMTLDFMDPAKTKEAPKYNIGERVEMALGFMDPARTRDREVITTGGTSDFTTGGFVAAPNFRDDLRNMYDEAVRDYGAFREVYENTGQGSNARRFAGIQRPGPDSFRRFKP